MLPGGTICVTGLISVMPQPWATEQPILSATSSARSAPSGAAPQRMWRSAERSRPPNRGVLGDASRARPRRYSSSRRYPNRADTRSAVTTRRGLSASTSSASGIIELCAARLTAAVTSRVSSRMGAAIA